MSRLVHLNGPPGIGKSTLARRYVSQHPGVLNCDVDVLRTLVGGWETDFAGVGELVRPAALAMIEAHLASGHDVVLPQLLVRPAELARFEAAAHAAGADLVERVLMDDGSDVVGRFARRGDTGPRDPWHDQVRALVAAAGGDAVLTGYRAALVRLVSERPGALVVTSTEGDVDETYRRLVASLS